MSRMSAYQVRPGTNSTSVSEKLLQKLRKQNCWQPEIYLHWIDDLSVKIQNWTNLRKHLH